MSQSYPDAFAALRRFRLLPWDQIPDLGLYMDQVVTLIGRMFEPVYGDDVKSMLSAPMINNYVKAKLIPRPVGKKYSREQVALLTMIVALKQVCSMEEIRRMLPPEDGVEALYDAFRARYDYVLQTLEPTGDALSPALDLAVLAAGCRVGCIASLNAEDSSDIEA